jgi:hypothetical protein
MNKIIDFFFDSEEQLDEYKKMLKIGSILIFSALLIAPIVMPLLVDLVA